MAPRERRPPSSWPLFATNSNGLFVLPEPGSMNRPRPLTDEEYNKVISSRPDTILLTPAFGLQNTRSPRAVEARATYARLQAKERSGAPLTAGEHREIQTLMPFVSTDEE